MGPFIREGDCNLPLPTRPDPSIPESWRRASFREVAWSERCTSTLCSREHRNPFGRCRCCLPAGHAGYHYCDTPDPEPVPVDPVACWLGHAIWAGILAAGAVIGWLVGTLIGRKVWR